MRKRDPLEGVPQAPRAADPAAPVPASLRTHQEEVRRRQRSRALVMGLVLALFAVLLYAITIAKIGLL